MNFNVLNDDGSIKSTEQILKEEEQRQEMVDEMIEFGLKGVLFFFRWPFAPIWKYRQPSWFFFKLIPDEKVAFIAACLSGGCFELMALWFSFGERLWSLNFAGPSEHPSAALVSWLMFGAMTLLRMFIWHEREWEDSPTG